MSLERSIDQAIARENHDQAGLPAEDIAFLGEIKFRTVAEIDECKRCKGVVGVDECEDCGWAGELAPKRWAVTVEGTDRSWRAVIEAPDAFHARELGRQAAHEEGHVVPRHGQTYVEPAKTCPACNGEHAELGRFCATCREPVPMLRETPPARVWGQSCRYCTRYQRPCGRHEGDR